MKMSNLLKIFAFATLTLAFTGIAQSQKIGYLNSVALLQEIPEVKQANANLEALQKQLQKKGQGMVEELQKKYVEIQRKEQQGELSPKQMEDEARKIREEESKIAQYEQDMQNQISEKQQTLLQPILDRVNTVISDVAKEHGYNYIFDASSGMILFADESDDITDLVKGKLGVQ